MATILLVDDEEPLRAVLAEMLSDDGYRVLQACNGRDALAQIREGRVQLVLSDVMMPVMDGLALCQTLKAQHETAELPVILMTAAAAEERAVKVCADAVLTKPFDLDALEELVDRCLSA